MEIIKLGSWVKDAATERRGMLTHVMFESQTHPLFYHFQPRGLNPETGAPLEGQWLVPGRIAYERDTRCEEIDLPLDVIGTQVSDDASGFSGVCVAITLHISGCIHVDIQPQKPLKSTRALVKAQDFDIRRCTGRAIKRISESERASEQKKKPSPTAAAPVPMR